MTTVAVLPAGTCLSRAAMRITGHSNVIAAVRHGTYALRTGGRYAPNAIATGSASSDQRTGADGSAAGLEL